MTEPHKDAVVTIMILGSPVYALVVAGLMAELWPDVPMLAALAIAVLAVAVWLGLAWLVAYGFHGRKAGGGVT